MKLLTKHPEVFCRALHSVARFSQRAHFELGPNGVHVRTIDPHEFCYADLSFKRSFFDGEFDGSPQSHGLDMTKLARILPVLSRSQGITIHVNDQALDLDAAGPWRLNYRIGWLAKDSYEAPRRPKKILYEAAVHMAAEDLENLIDTASAVSKEIVLTVRNGSFKVTAASEDLELAAKPSTSIQIRSESKCEVSAHVLSNYLDSLRTLMDKCSAVKILLGTEKPTRFDFFYDKKATFSFVLSGRKPTGPQRHEQSKSLPRLTATRFPDFLVYLATSAKGESPHVLQIAGLESSNGDYSRLATRLGMVTYERGRLQITSAGIHFVNLLKSDMSEARLWLHKSMYDRIPEYSIIINTSKSSPVSMDDLVRIINRRAKRIGKQPVLGHEVLTFLGLATWCRVMDRRMALSYFGKAQKRD